MKTFLHKMKLSFRAMVCGWVACNIALWLARLPEMLQSPAQGGITSVLFYGFFSGVVILAAWLAIFLPVDLLVPDHSKLRTPWRASVCGFLAGCGVVAVLWICNNGSPGSFAAWDELLTWKALLLLGSPGITGMVAAYVRSRDHEPSFTRARPQPMNRVSKAYDILDIML